MNSFDTLEIWDEIAVRRSNERKARVGYIKYLDTQSGLGFTNHYAHVDFGNKTEVVCLSKAEWIKLDRPTEI